MAGKLKVLITGASGYVASQMLPEYRERYDLVLVDVKNTDRDGEVVDGVVVADLADPDRSRYEHLFDGVDSVIHLGYMRSEPGGVFGSETPQIDRFDVELANVRMANNVYRAAYDAGVRRVVAASSNHAADWYEDYQVHVNRKDMVRPGDFACVEQLLRMGQGNLRTAWLAVRVRHIWPPPRIRDGAHRAPDSGKRGAAHGRRPRPAAGGLGDRKLQAQPRLLLQPARPAATIPQSR